MKKIELFERAIAERAERLQDYGINSTAFWAYRKSIDAGNDLIDFSDVIWDYDIEAIAQTFADSGITEFTISSRFSDLIPTLAAFDKLGFKMAAMTEVNAAYTDWQTGKHPQRPRDPPGTPLRRETTMWKESSIKVNGEVFHYWMKQYEEGSEWGIEGGRISKLMLKRDGKIVCNYDRGWDIEPTDENTQLALELLLHSENW